MPSPTPPPEHADKDSMYRPVVCRQHKELELMRKRCAVIWRQQCAPHRGWECAMMSASSPGHPEALHPVTASSQYASIQQTAGQ